MMQPPQQDLRQLAKSTACLPVGSVKDRANKDKGNNKKMKNDWREKKKNRYGIGCRNKKQQHLYRESLNRSHRRERIRKYLANPHVQFLLGGLLVFLLLFAIADAVTDDTLEIRLAITGHEMVGEFGVQQLGLAESVQVGTQMDVFNVAASKGYANFGKYYLRKYAAKRQYTPHFQKNKTPTPNISLGASLATLSSNMTAEEFLAFVRISLSNQLYNRTAVGKGTQQEADNEAADNMEYEYVERVFGISKLATEPTLCILSHLGDSGVDVSAYLQSLVGQNYTRYRVLLIDDRAHPPQSDTLQHLLKLAKSSKFVLLRNNEQMGRVGSYFVHAHKCKQGEIVMYLDVGDQLVGRQAFRILGALFAAHQDIWMVYPQYLITRLVGQGLEQGFKKNFQHSVLFNQYRNSELGAQWPFSNVVAHRSQLLAKLPFSHFIQYQKKQDPQVYAPQFHQDSQNRFLIYSLLQLCGAQHAYFLEYPLFIHVQREEKGEESSCSGQLGVLNQYKAQVKVPMAPLNSMDSPGRVMLNHSLPGYRISQYREAYQNYAHCLAGIK